MPTLIEQLQQEALNPAVAVSGLLRRVKLAAVKLKLSSVETWVAHELNGYGDSPVPSYRQIRGVPKALNPVRGWIPFMGDPNFIRSLSQQESRQSVPELESLLSHGSGGSLYIPFAPEMVNLLNSGNMVSFGQMGLFVDQSSIVGIVDTVRNRVLDWSLELERQGVLGTDIGFSPDEVRKASSVSISIKEFNGNFNSGEISGGGARLRQQTNHKQSNHTSFAALRDAIESEVRSSDRDQLMQAVSRLEASQGKGGFLQAYTAFVGAAADHMTIVTPFIPWLTTLLAAS